MLESLAGQAAFTSFNTVDMHSISLGLHWISIWQSPLHHRGACEDTEAFPIELYHCFRERWERLVARTEKTNTQRSYGSVCTYRDLGKDAWATARDLCCRTSLDLTVQNAPLLSITTVLDWGLWKSSLQKYFPLYIVALCRQEHHPNSGVCAGLILLVLLLLCTFKRICVSQKLVPNSQPVLMRLFRDRPKITSRNFFVFRIANTDRRPILGPNWSGLDFHRFWVKFL